MKAIQKRDQIFLDELKEIVLANLASENFGVNELANQAGLSNQSLNRKLKSVYGNTVSSFIREVRLRKALEMIRDENLTVAEVAYKTGFSSPTYFNTCFHDFFGVSPGAVKRGEKLIVDEPANEFRNDTGKKKMALFAIPVIILVLASIIFLGNRLSTANKASKGVEKSIAVLPFVNDSPNPENEYLCNGIMEDILDQLYKIGNIKVKSRSSVEEYRGADRDLKAIGRKLGVNMIMEGSVRRVEDDIRITAQLIDTRTGYHLWSDTYDGKYSTEIFDFQIDIAKKVAQSLDAVITQKEVRNISARPTENILAHDLFMKAEELIKKNVNEGGEQNLKLAINLIDNALLIDSKYVKALNSKANAYSKLGMLDSALFYSRKVLALDQINSSALGEIGTVYFYTRETDSALIYLNASINNGENDVNIFWRYLTVGQVLFRQKAEITEAFRYYQKSYELGGYSEASINYIISNLFAYIGDYSKAYYYSHKAQYLTNGCKFIRGTVSSLIAQEKYEKAFNFLDSIGRITPCENVCDIMRLYLYTCQKNYSKSETLLKKAINSGYKLTEDDQLYVSCLYKETGKLSEVEKELESIIERHENEIQMGGGSFIRVAAAYAILEDNQMAIKYLSEFEKHTQDEHPFIIKNFPGFNGLRNDPDFISLLKNLEEKRDSLRSLVQGMIESGELNL